MTATFPGGTSVTLLDVYDDAAPDGLFGGSPHMHLASTECYVVVAGVGALHTLTVQGLKETPLTEGAVVWFEPGTIHRAVNLGGLRVLVVMSNAGLPEAGDAVMTFPAQIVSDPAAYRQAASLPAEGTEAERAVAARRRRDLAVVGFGELVRAHERGDSEPLEAFQAAAARIVGPRVDDWRAIVEQGPAAQAARTLEVLAELQNGNVHHLQEARVRQPPPLPPQRAFGMCGRLSAYDVSSR